ncbi:MAG: hypothetical protein PUD15_06595 [Prevotella sp.]|uniref:hypothetical protein n=1 Tax=Prevotella sp. AGR2160 TaxID=1280674 RepID=UPI0004157CE6|nr:hypothetical protein [Prevotella sp. AGR2160]MDD5862215.1 hypothetical protein [Prevotella sp.]
MNKLQTILFIIGGVLMVIGAGCFSFGFIFPALVSVACWVYLVGSLLFSVLQAIQEPSDSTLVLRRLKRIQLMADIFFVLAGISMVDTAYGFFRDLFANYETYLTYFYNKWVLLLLIAAVLELYTVHRIDHEERKRQNTNAKKN